MKAGETNPSVTSTFIKNYTPSNDSFKNIQILQDLYNNDEFSQKEKMEIIREVGREAASIAYDKSKVSEYEYQQKMVLRTQADEDVKEKNRTILLHLKKMEDLDGEELDKKEKELKELYDEIEILHEQRKLAFKEANDAHSKLGEAYIQTIGEIRGEEMGPGDEGIILSQHAKSRNKKAGEALAKHLTCYPRSWIEKSNSIRNLYPVFSSDNAHYLEYKEISAGKTQIVPHSFTGGEVPLEFSHEYKELTDEEREEHGLNKYHSSHEKLYEELNVTFHNDFYDGVDDNGNPIGKGWKKITVYNKDYNTGGYSSQERWAKVRRKRRQTKQAKHGVAQIVFGEHVTGVGTARHEFAHRMEDMCPEIGRMEEQYLFSRKAPDEQLIKLESGGKTYADSFNNTYTGKIYENSLGDKNSKYHEVLSTSIEDMFSSTANEGNITKGSRIDTDLRNFTLGILSTIKPKYNNNLS